MTSTKENNHKNQNGQTFIEFILILVLLMIVSFTFMRSFNYLIGTRWEVMVKIIARPDSDGISLP